VYAKRNRKNEEKWGPKAVGAGSSLRSSPPKKIEEEEEHKVGMRAHHRSSRNMARFSVHQVAKQRRKSS